MVDVQLNDIIEKVKALPPLPTSFQKINEICDDPEGSIGELAKVIEHDPMITANIIKAASSPLYGLRHEIRNVLQAVSLFGMSMTRSIAANISIKKLLSVDLEPYSISPDTFTDISTMQSALIKSWYSKVDKSKLELLFLPALLQEIGKIIISDEIIRANQVKEFKDALKQKSISEVEKEFVGMTTAKVTATMLNHWNFDEIFVNIIDNSDNYMDAPEEIREYSFALKVIKTVLPTCLKIDEENVNKAAKMVSDFGMDEELFLNVIKEFQG